MIDARAIRISLNLTQDEFAKRFNLKLATVRQWEQGRREPHGAALTLLEIIKKIPDAVDSALHSTAR
ncbi:helix-turn-helix domain-containing protein [Bradyrhizobium sp.]